MARKKRPKPGDPDWRITKAHSKNFNTLLDAVKARRVCLMDCVLKATGEHVAVITLTNDAGNGDTGFVPMAMFFNGNPYEMLLSPMEYDPMKGGTNGETDA